MTGPVEDVEAKDLPCSDGAGEIWLLGAIVESGNLGCRALAVSLIGLIQRVAPRNPIALFYGEQRAKVMSVAVAANRQVDVEVLNYRLSPRAPWQEHLLWMFGLALLYRLVPNAAFRSLLLRSHLRLGRLARASRVGDINGGDSFADLYGFGRFLITVLPALIVLLLKKRLILLPQTYGPYRGLLARWLARWIVRRAAVAYARDERSLEVLRALNGAHDQRRRLRLCPDVAFALEPVLDGQPRFAPLFPKSLQETVIGLNVSGLLDIGGYTGRNMFGLRTDYAQTVEMLLDGLLQQESTRICLIPHTFGEVAQSDARACRRVWSALMPEKRARVHLLESEHDQSGLKAVIGGCQFFIGSRMHACIAALSQGIPAVGIAYSDKFHGVFASVGLEELVVDARRVEGTGIVDACVAALRRREELRARLGDRLRGVWSDLERCFLEEFGSPPSGSTSRSGGRE